MARIFIDGFEGGDFSLWDFIISTGGDPVIATGVSGMDGTYCAYLPGNACGLAKILPSAAEYYVAFRFRPHVSYGKAVCSFRNGIAVLGAVQRNSTSGFLEIYRGSTLIQTGTTVVTNAGNYLIEVRYKPHLTDGTFQVKIDGILEFDIEAGDGIRTGEITANIESLYFYAGPGSNNLGWIDNVIVDTNSWIGSTKIVAIVPTANAGLNELTPSTGDNFECVNEIPASDVDYVSSDVVDKSELYSHDGLPGAVFQVKSVQLAVRAVKEGAATPQNLTPHIKVDATIYPAASYGLTTFFFTRASMFATNPATGVAWTVDEVNALAFGFKTKV